ncbi:MAG: cell division protein ZipA [Xanthomonadales bacterium]|nr:cell division protein ZipA [Xanthomonadales bacterium]
MSPNELRVLLLIVGIFVLIGIYYFGRPSSARRDPRDRSHDRLEPWIHQGDEAEQDEEFEQADAEASGRFDDFDEPAKPAGPAEKLPGERPDSDFDRIVTLFLLAREGGTIQGQDLVVAAEKAGLVFGDKCIYHRLIDGRPDQGPVFSVANLTEPGSFELSAMDRLSTPGVCFFMTLPGPLSALEALDTLLPAAQRMSELLDAQLLDEERNALGRQRILSLRDEMRQYDRQQAQESVNF